MKRLLLVTLVLCCGANSFSQTPEPTPAPQPPSVANYSIMLVNPAGDGGVVIMHNPQNVLELVDVSKMQAALSAGYVPVRSVELAELIGSFKEEIARLSDENSHLRSDHEKQASGTISSMKDEADFQAQRAQIENEQRAQAEAEKQARRQQVIQMWMGLQPRTLNLNINSNVNVKDCTRFPALCAR